MSTQQPHLPEAERKANGHNFHAITKGRDWLTCVNCGIYAWDAKRHHQCPIEPHYCDCPYCPQQYNPESVAENP